VIVPCGACGVRLPLARNEGLWPELVAEWELTPEWARWFSAREGHRCRWCGCNLRSQQLAMAIVQFVNAQHGTSARHLRALFRDPRARRLPIAEINSAGQLHKYLQRCDGLRYSEYGSRTPSAHVFTVPVVWGRQTRKRAELEEGRVVHILPPSYHGRAGDARNDLLVFHEFGDDVVGRVETAGFEVERIADPDNPALVTFVARRRP